MNTNARQWVNALRSGKYKQGRMALRTPDGYCCLGVACDVYARETGLGEWEQGSDGTWCFNAPASDEAPSDVLPYAVCEWLGLNDNDGTYEHDGSSVWFSLSQHNDSGANFREIADIILSEPKRLFS